MSAPRLLPMIAVAMGGVLAVKALSGAQALPDLLSATKAQAEEAPKSSARKSAPPAGSARSTAPPLPGPAQLAAAKPPPACVESPADLAREAGVSPGELQALQNLQARRGQLDDREKALDTQLQLLAAAEAKVDAKLKAVNDVKAQVQALIGQAGQQQQADVDRLVTVYEKMKPRDAAAVMATLDDRVRIPVAAKMKPAALAAVLAQMPTLEAKKVTESLAQRADNAKQALNTAAQTPPAAPNPATQSTDPLAATPAPVSPRGKHARPRKLAAARAPIPAERSAADLAPAKPVGAAAPAQPATAAAAPAASAPAKPTAAKPS
jgi:flagellar motility protein MotE (MotC chaperone)